MNINQKYIFTSERLGFRNWKSSDLDEMYAINTDKKVMEFFPSLSSKTQTEEFITRMQNQFSEKGFCYYAVDLLENQEFIGFIGISVQTYTAPFTPCIDIGWRIKYSKWNNGYATEGAEKCVKYAFEVLKIKKLYAIAPKINLKSILIMSKIGMEKQYEFDHPYLWNDERLKACVLYEIKA